jgi:hypothetical protein
MARPSGYNDEIADRLCEEIASGRSVLELTTTEDWAPHEATVYRWLFRYEEFCKKYARAKAAQQDADLEKIIQIADAATPESVNVDKLRIDTRKWSMARLAPNKYGDTQRVVGPGADGEHKHKVAADESFNHFAGLLGLAAASKAGGSSGEGEVD